jgi:hypothetical protein
MRINDKISNDLQIIANVFNTNFTSVAENFLKNLLKGTMLVKKSNILFISSIWSILFKDET